MADSFWLSLQGVGNRLHSISRVFLGCGTVAVESWFTCLVAFAAEASEGCGTGFSISDLAEWFSAGKLSDLRDAV